MAKQDNTSVRQPVHTPLSNSLSAVSSLSSSNSSVKTIRVFKNGDPYHQGVKFVLNRRYVHDMDQLLNMISEKLDLPYGAKKLYNFDGKLLKHLTELEDKQEYVASSNHFIRQKYGKQMDSVSHPLWSMSATKLPPIRTSRSQTRMETKPSIKKRSQSGTTSASTTSNSNAKMRIEKKPTQVPVSNTATVPPFDGDTRKRKAVKKKKKKTEGNTMTKTEVKIENNKEATVVEKRKEVQAKEGTVEMTKDESSQTEGTLSSPVPKSVRDRENEYDRSRTPSDSGSMASDHGDSEYGTDSVGDESEEEHSPGRLQTPKTNSKARRPSTGRKRTEAKSSESKEESD